MDQRSWRLLAVFALGAILVVAWFWFQGRPQSVQSVTDTGVVTATLSGQIATSGSPTIAPLLLAGDVTGFVVVHVAGEVRKPGLQRLSAGSRVADAIEASGGVANAKAENSVNLARLLVDGEQIYVGTGMQLASGTQQSGTTQQSGITQGGGFPTGKVSVNSASQQQLETLPGVGPSLAQRILDYRSANGSFHSVDELDDVSGIGPATLTRLRPLIQL